MVIDTVKNITKSKFLYISTSHYDVDWHSTLHSHPFTELFYVIRGQGSFQFRDQTTVPVKADDMAIINPNVLHTEISDPDNPLEYIVVGIDGVAFSIDEHDTGFSIHNYYKHKHDILFYLKSILVEKEDCDSYSEMIIDHLLKTLLINVIRRTSVSLNISDEDTSLNHDCIFIENYINIHYREKITLDLLASLTFMNKYYLSHMFKEHSGYAPIDFLLNKRIHEAEKLLANTDLSISQISGIVGFGSSSYFSQYFRKVHNMSASEYRKMHRVLL
ncbi:AraC family transcriptional regulator [Erysipelothrix sp. HDW6C]|uniref:helix-turn-helix transcriptional regulator n=1 Tax=Erysipelothrix sp. HDW6C TaxID=2714930 RepID=UPI00140B748E|nr:AraC family transcriptional regulator [Erysipelothrix sp. HDW6C]QIK69191.1 AraC family transcriptional regulator [Erysipelothrix sp. HDW6C]